MLFKQCGNIPIDVQKMNIDMLSLSGHKIYAPKGVGALYVKKGIEFERFMDGGHQEIVALGKAAQIAEKNLKEYQKKLRDLRDYCLKQIEDNIPNIHINGTMEKRLPGNINISFEGVDSSELLFKLDELGICASGGSACSSGDNNPSHVLTAIGVPNELAKGAIRFTIGDFNTKEDIDYLVKSLKQLIL